MREVPLDDDGKIIAVRALDRDGERLNMVGPIGVAAKLLARHSPRPRAAPALARAVVGVGPQRRRGSAIRTNLGSPEKIDTPADTAADRSAEDSSAARNRADVFD
jgi:hypothetical protein